MKDICRDDKEKTGEQEVVPDEVNGKDTALLKDEALIDAAMDILQIKGIEGLTIKSVAMASGISVQEVQKAFANKEDMFLVLLDRHLEKLVADLEKSLGISDTKEAILSLADDYRNYYMAIGKYVNLFTYLFELGSDYEALNLNIINSIREKMQTIFLLLTGLFERKETKRALKGLPPERGVAVVWCAIQGIAQITLHSVRAEESGVGFDDVLNDFIHILL